MRSKSENHDSPPALGGATMVTRFGVALLLYPLIRGSLFIDMLFIDVFMAARRWQAGEPWSIGIE